MKATVSFGNTVINPKASIRVLGLHIDSKLKWGPHITVLKAKMDTQELGLKMVAASTWGATLKKARTVYSAVVRPAMTFGAKIWHQPGQEKGPAEKIARDLSRYQNRCLRVITGGYKSTPIPVLEAESHVPNIRVHLDVLVLQALKKRGANPAVRQGNRRIQAHLRRHPGRGGELPLTPMNEKRQWAAESLPDPPPTNLKPQSLPLRLRRWREGEQAERWKAYQTGLQTSVTPAQRGEWSHRRIDVHDGLQKAESSAVVQIRSQHIGFNRYLFKRKVPGIEGPSCPCGWWSQDVKHILMNCPRYQHHRPNLLLAAGTYDYDVMVSTSQGIRAAARWLVRSGALGQYSLARVQLESDQ